MANHGYLPHNGVGTIEDFMTGCTEAFGMGKHKPILYHIQSEAF